MIKKCLLTSALPYANGVLHMGHTLEFIQTDIWCKYQKMIGNFCVYLSGDDCHGTPIMLKSMQSKCSVDYLINFYHILHAKDLHKLDVNIDNFYLTHSYENEFFSRRIFNFLKFNNFIFEDEIYQFYDEDNQIFLPDRYVIGKCPKCNAVDQYGDVCEKCSYKYDATELIDPVSILSKKKPIEKVSNHYFFDLKKFENFLKEQCEVLSQKSVANKLFDWFSTGLKVWDISREFPYFGFKIPNEYFKFFYVWIDAPIGYIASLYNYCLKLNVDLSLFLDCNSEYKLYHFIGKDIVYFHALFWPAVLKVCNLKLPDDILVHGFLTINGKKMSKSSGTFLILNDFLNNFESDFVRYYFASKLNDNISDIDFNFDEFFDKINSDLISKFVNIGSRCAKIICNNFDYKLSNRILDQQLFYEFLSFEENIRLFYEKKCYSKVIFNIMKYADFINLYLDREKPWLLLKDKNSVERAHDVCTTALNLFIVLLFYFKPILPNLFDRFTYLFNLSKIDLSKLKKPLLNIKIKSYIHVYKRINKVNIKDIFGK